MTSVPKGDLASAIAEIDAFAQKNWMMNLGPQKAQILKKYCSYKTIDKVLQIGGYCGYSALTFASLLPKAEIHTVQIKEEYANIARKVEKHAGVEERIHVHVGTVTTLQ